MTAKLLDELKIPYRRISRSTSLKGVKTLVIGREALTAAEPLPNLDAVRDGLNVLVFEQPTAVLERLGFRYNEYGLRRLFPRDFRGNCSQTGVAKRRCSPHTSTTTSFSARSGNGAASKIPGSGVAATVGPSRRP